MLGNAHGPWPGAEYKRDGREGKGFFFTVISSSKQTSGGHTKKGVAIASLLFAGARGVIDFTVESLAGHAICLFHIFHLQVANQLLIQFFVYLMFVSCTVFSVDAECI